MARAAVAAALALLCLSDRSGAAGSGSGLEVLAVESAVAGLRVVGGGGASLLVEGLDARIYPAVSAWTEAGDWMGVPTGAGFRIPIDLPEGQHRLFLGAPVEAGGWNSFARVTVWVAGRAPAEAAPEPGGAEAGPAGPELLQDWIALDPLPTAQVEEFVLLSGSVDGASELVASTAVAAPGGQITSTQVLPVAEGRFSARVWLRYGGGAYQIWLSRPDGKGGLEAGAHLTVRNLSERDLRYLAPAGAIRSEDPAVVFRARELTAGRKNDRDRARAINDWVHGWVNYDPTVGAAPGRTALDPLRDRRGICRDYVYLGLALLRASGIPARFATGQVLLRGEWVAHGWVEARLAGRWVMMDPTLGLFDPEPGRLALTHRLSGYEN